MVYSLVRRFVKTFSGRYYYNVFDTVIFMTKKVHTVINMTYLTAIEVCKMLRLVASKYVGKKNRIVLDNAGLIIIA